MANSDNWGGARQGAGPPRRNLHLDKGTARTLSIITRHRRTLQPDITEEQVVKTLVNAEWQVLDAQFQENARAAKP